MYLLDTSAILAHILKEPGAELVDRIIMTESVFAAAPTWLELRVRLKEEDAAVEVLELLESGIIATVDVSATIARTAFELKSAATQRLPAMDSLIASCAAANHWILVHRDRHFLSIPGELLMQEMLPLER
jgi:predicted nucleic acid-binding protein